MFGKDVGLVDDTIPYYAYLIEVPESTTTATKERKKKRKKEKKRKKTKTYLILFFFLFFSSFFFLNVYDWLYISPFLLFLNRFAPRRIYRKFKVCNLYLLDPFFRSV